MKYTIIGIGLVVFLMFGLPALGFVQYSFFAPKYEEARRNVFEQTKSYKHGTIRDIENLKLSYELAETEAHKTAIKQTIRHRIAAFDANDIPPHLRNFIMEINQ